MSSTRPLLPALGNYPPLRDAFAVIHHGNVTPGAACCPRQGLCIQVAGIKQKSPSLWQRWTVGTAMNLMYVFEIETIEVNWTQRYPISRKYSAEDYDELSTKWHHGNGTDNNIYY